MTENPNDDLKPDLYDPVANTRAALNYIKAHAVPDICATGGSYVGYDDPEKSTGHEPAAD